MPDLTDDRAASDAIGETIARAEWDHRSQLHLAERFIQQAGLLPAYSRFLADQYELDETAGQLPEIRECCGHANTYDSCNCPSDACPCTDA